MVRVQQATSRQSPLWSSRYSRTIRPFPSHPASRFLRAAAASVACLVVVLLIVGFGRSPTSSSRPLADHGRELRMDVTPGGETSAKRTASTTANSRNAASSSSSSSSAELPLPITASSPGAETSLSTCPYRSLRDLTQEERYPKATASRHMVDPPASTVDTLVCCETTAGSISIAVRSGWAPHGSRRFLDMVRSGYFSRHDMSDGPNEGKVAGKDDRPDGSAAISERRRRGVVPLMRCVDGFLCQFGLRGGASARYAGKIPDDAPWLPRGSSGEARRNPLGVRRFMNGYLAYAGSGPNSRGRQIFVTLADQSGLGNAPWEVPFAEVVGSHSYQTLASIYKGYGEYGPSQESLMTDSGLEEAREQFPKLDWIVSCDVVDEEAAEGFASGPKAREE